MTRARQHLAEEEASPGRVDHEDLGDDAGIGHRRRSRAPVDYNEDHLLPPMDENEDGDEEDLIRPARKRARGNGDVDSATVGDDVAQSPDADDDSDEFVQPADDQFSYEDDGESDDSLDSDDIVRPKTRGFVVDDEDDESEREFSLHRRRPHPFARTRRATRSSKRLAKLYSDDETKSIREELRELVSDSPMTSPKRNLRDRKEVNYTLPPPELTDAQLFGTNEPVSKRGGRFGGSGTQSSQIRRLFPTQGPFGGSEVTSFFQQDINLAAIGNVESSDSEDEDMTKQTNPGDLSNIITASTANPTKKKNTLADTDPLGIDTNIDFSVIGGLENYINQLKEMITLPLLYPEVYSKFHITPPRGVLFHGPPGTGKTLMARALAASCSSQNQKITFFMRKGADCLSKWVGEAERHLRLLFEEAKEHQPSIIFFDEIDGLAPVRSSKQEQIHASIVSTLLALMDGMDNRGQVIIIGATNRPDSIDPALRRPGRFDREFYFPLPDLNARKDILNIHMRKWENKMNDSFVEELARLTKGYGGADLKSLCTESALISIQRSYPQIYKSNDKLKINLNKIKVQPLDFTIALKKIIPNSIRSTNVTNQPIPSHLSELLAPQLDTILESVERALPLHKKVTVIEESEFVSTNNNFESQQTINSIDSLRVFKPRLIMHGEIGQGLKYVSNGLINKLDGVSIQVLDFNKLFSDSSISIENLIIQLFNELKRNKPSVLFIPDLIGFFSTIPASCKSVLKYLINGLNPNDKILILVEVEGELTDDLLDEVEDIFDIAEDQIVHLRNCTKEERTRFFNFGIESIFKTPLEYNDLAIRPKRILKDLPIVERPKVVENTRSKKEQVKTDMKLKNSLKLKLSGLMDLFKARYKKFKKPIIDDVFLAHLFDPEPPADSNYKIQDDKILEVDTGKTFFNIDLDVIEERLWNGFYSEPKQFLDDLNLISKDSIVSGDRDRILKSNEMMAHASVGVEEIETQFPQLAEQWRELRQREKKLQAQAAVEMKPLTAEDPAGITESGAVIDEMGENGQVQLQIQPSDNQTTVVDEVELRPEMVVIESQQEEPKEELMAQEKEKEPREKEPEGEHQPEEESSEEEVDIPVQTVQVDPAALEKLRKTLVEKTEGKNIMHLERVYSKMMKLVWQHRLELAKEPLLEDLSKLVESI